VKEGEFLAGVIGVRAQLDEGVPVCVDGDVLIFISISEKRIIHN
jgi:hypothetical protein